MNLVLIIYILLWAAIIKIYGFDVLIVVGGFIILAGTLIGMWKTKKEKYLLDNYTKKKHKSKKNN